MELLEHFLPDTPQIRLENWTLDKANTQLQVTVASTQAIAPCPLCQTLSHRVHSRYERTLQDLTLAHYNDIGYVKKSEAETSVLFELIAHRYERRSLLVTANQPFSQWDAIFSDSMMTVAAVDRLVHHALILEIQAESFRKQAATGRSGSK